MHLIQLATAAFLFAYPSSASPVGHLVAKARELSSGTVSSSTPLSIPWVTPTVPPEVARASREQGIPDTRPPGYYASHLAAVMPTLTVTWPRWTFAVRDSIATDEAAASSVTITATASEPIFAEAKPVLQPRADAGILGDLVDGVLPDSSSAQDAPTVGPLTNLALHSTSTSISKFFPEIVLVTPGVLTTQTSTLKRSSSSMETIITPIDPWWTTTEPTPTTTSSASSSSDIQETVITPIDPWWTTTAKRNEASTEEQDQPGTTVVKVIRTHTVWYTPEPNATATTTSTSDSSSTTAITTAATSTSTGLPLWMTLTDIGTWTATAIM